jgi:1,4-alpha-glucan branching enzyme
VSAAFLHGYLTTADGEPFVPRDPAHTVILLDAFLLEKAIYELVRDEQPPGVGPHPARRDPRDPRRSLAAVTEDAMPPDRPTAASIPASTPASTISGVDLHLFNEGSHFRLWEKLGAHPAEVDGVAGASFAVWAPNASHVAVVGDFNRWDGAHHPLSPRHVSGIWEGFVPGVRQGDTYKFRVRSADGVEVDKADPFAVHAETPPATGSKVWDLAYEWHDDDWMAGRAHRQRLDQPLSIYELHLGSWRRRPEEGDRPLSYAELADPLVEHVTTLGFTHVEFLPLMEHPFGGSWGYQTTGYFAPTSRFGTPQDLKFLIDRLHAAGIGVILDWVPSHFPVDQHGLASFDGTHLFEHADPRQGFHPDWKSAIFNVGRNEVVSFLISSAMFWLDEYHVDGLRVDAVASMLYLDYSREEGEWIPNQWGGNENLESIAFLRRFNEEVYAAFPGVQTIAEESTAWPMVSRPTYCRWSRVRHEVGHGMDARHLGVLRARPDPSASTTTTS